MNIYLVNEADEVLEVVDITTISDWSKVIYRTSAIWLYNEQGEILTAQRAHTKRMCPGMWGPSAAGIIEGGEDYESNILKEVQEELGYTINPSDLHKSYKALMEQADSGRRYFMQFYFAPCNLPAEQLTLQTEEVAAARWIAPAELAKANTDMPDQYLDIIPEIITNLPTD